jgi:hypothetical protein
MKNTKAKNITIAAIVLLISVLLLSRSSSILVMLAIIFLSGAIPFIIGFVLQIAAWRKKISLYIIWAISVAMQIYASYLSKKSKAFLFPDLAEEYPLLKLFFVILSIIIYVVFMQWGGIFSQKIIKKLTGDKSAV